MYMEDGIKMNNTEVQFLLLWKKKRKKKNSSQEENSSKKRQKAHCRFWPQLH